MARLIRGRSLLAGGLLAGAALGLGACGHGAAVSQARQACTTVNESLKIYSQITPTTPPAEANQLTADAQAKLLSALPSAAAATSGDGSFNALMTTISEATRVPENLLVPSLTAQCKVVLSNTPYLAS